VVMGLPDTDAEQVSQEAPGRDGGQRRNPGRRR